MENKLFNFLSKFMTLVLAMIMAIGSAGVTAFAAADTDKADIIITNLEGPTVSNQGTEVGSVTVTAYKVAYIKYDSNGAPAQMADGSYYYWNNKKATGASESAKSVAEWVNENYSDYISVADDSVTPNEYAITDAYRSLEDNSNALKAFNHALYAAIRSGAVSVDETGSSTSSTKTSESGQYYATVKDMTAGEYLVVASGGEKVYTPTTINHFPKKSTSGSTTTWTLSTTTLTMKGEKPTITKTVSTGQSEKVGIGETVSYTISALIPEYPLNSAVWQKTGDKLSITDTPSLGLTLNKDSITVKDSSGNVITNENNENYTITDVATTDTTSAGFKVSFTDAFLQNVGYTGQNVVVEYNATVNTNAWQQDALKNKATLTYYNSPYVATETDTETSEEEVFTYGAMIGKKDKNGQYLTGAKFKIYKGNGEEDVTDENLLYFTSGGTAASQLESTKNVNIYNLSGNTSDTDRISEIEVGTHGDLQLRGLPAGSYVLIETVAPTGYSKPDNGCIVFTIVDNDTAGGSKNVPDGNIDTNTPEVTTSGQYALTGTPDTGIREGKTKIINFSVRNNAVGEEISLPHTGGIGTTIFTVGGILLMAGAAAYMIISKKKKSAE